jgi:nitrite reductase/ring-hydroxylating ferredoxin subunit
VSAAGGVSLDERPILCSLEDIPDPGAISVLVGQGPRALDVIIARRGANVIAFHNTCPHQGTPLETFPGRFLDEEASHLVCSTHGARFRFDDGVCVWGPCEGDRLTSISIDVENGAVRLAAQADVQRMLDGS